MKFLSKKEAKQLLKRFKIDLKVLENYSLVRDKDEISIISNDYSKVPVNELNIKSIGLIIIDERKKVVKNLGSF